MNRSHLPPSLALACAVAILAAPLPGSEFGSADARGFALFQGPPGGNGIVVLRSERDGSLQGMPAGLVGARLLPIDVHGRSGLDRLLPGRPRVIDDLPGGASRLMLPDDGGALYRFERSESTGGRIFGFAHIDRLGRVRTFAERAGSGPQRDSDPYLSRVGLAPDGGALLVGTTRAAGGNALEIDLVSGSITDRTAALAPLDIVAEGLALNADWGVVGTRGGIYRFDRQPGAQVQSVPLDPATPPSWYAGEVVLSPNGAWAITGAGMAQGSAFAYVFGRTGSGRRASQVPGPIGPAGFLPEWPAGPFLAVSDDGNRAAWCRDIGLASEAFLAEVKPQGPIEVQLTSNQYFTDTFDEVGTLGFLSANALTLAVGEAALPEEGGIEALDLFAVRLDAQGGPVFENLTGTGSPAPPFVAPAEIDPEGWILRVPEAGRILMLDGQSGGTGRLVTVRPDRAGLEVYLNDVKGIGFVERVGSRLVLGVDRRNGPSDSEILVAPIDLSRPPVTLHGDLLGGTYEHPVLLPRDRIAFFGVDDLGVRLLHRLDLRTGQHELFPYLAGDIAPTMGLSPKGALVFSIGTALTPARVVLWPSEGAPRPLPVSPSPGHLLPSR